MSVVINVDDQNYNLSSLDESEQCDLVIELVKKRDFSQLQLCLANKLPVNFHDIKGYTPLHYAVMHSDATLVTLLLAYEADIHALDANRNNCALLCCTHNPNPSLLLILMRFNFSIWAKNREAQAAIHYIFSLNYTDEFWLYAIGLDREANILCSLKSPLLLVHRLFKLDKKMQNKSTFSRFIEKLLKTQNVVVLKILVLWNISLTRAASIRRHEENDLLQYANRIENAIAAIFNGFSLDQPVNLQKLLQPDISVYEHISLLKYQLNAFRQYSVLDLCLQHQCKFIFEKQQILRFVNDLFYYSAKIELSDFIEKKSTIFQQMNPFDNKAAYEEHKVSDSIAVQSGIEKERVTIASKTTGNAISNYMQQDMDRGSLFEAKEKETKIVNLTSIQSIDLAFRLYHVDLLSNSLVKLSYALRSCPAVRFAFEALVRLVMVVGIADVSVKAYGKRCGVDFTAKCDVGVHGEECILVSIFVSTIIYEIGEIAELRWSITQYFKNEWKLLDLFGLVLGLLWMATRIYSLNLARVFLAVAAIPLSLGLLRYLMLSKTLGTMVTIARAMFKDIVAFAALYLVFILGFSIFFISLFRGNGTFDTPASSVLQMFEYTLASFDFSVFNSTSRAVNTLAQVILMIFLISTVILLINLLIAKMSAAYQKIDDRAIAEWAYSRTEIVKQNLLIIERHPFCMLLPPFNIITALAYFVHYNNLKKGISIAGTIANIVYNQLAGGMRATGFFISFAPEIKNMIMNIFTRKELLISKLIYTITNMIVLAGVCVLLTLTVLMPSLVDQRLPALPKVGDQVEYVTETGVPLYLHLNYAEVFAKGQYFVKDATAATSSSVANSISHGDQRDIRFNAAIPIATMSPIISGLEMTGLNSNAIEGGDKNRKEPVREEKTEGRAKAMSLLEENSSFLESHTSTQEGGIGDEYAEAIDSEDEDDDEKSLFTKDDIKGILYFITNTADGEADTNEILLKEISEMRLNNETISNELANLRNDFAKVNENLSQLLSTLQSGK